MVMGFRIEGSGFRNYGSGCRLQVQGFGLGGFGF